MTDITTPQQVVCTGVEGSDEWNCAFGTWVADDFGIDSNEIVGKGERLYVRRDLYDISQAKIAELEAALNTISSCIKQWQDHPKKSGTEVLLDLVKGTCDEALEKGDTMTDSPETRLVQVTATSTTSYNVTVKVPAGVTDDEVMGYYKEVGAHGEFEENGSDWVWEDAVEFDSVHPGHVEDLTDGFIKNDE
jgi:hypothetical protein